MDNFIAFFYNYRILSISTGFISAIFWLCSAFVKSKVKPHRVVLTMDEPHPKVDMHNFVLTARLQAKYNSIAACFAAVCALFQIMGL